MSSASVWLLRSYPHLTNGGRHILAMRKRVRWPVWQYKQLDSRVTSIFSFYIHAAPDPHTTGQSQRTMCFRGPLWESTLVFLLSHMCLVLLYIYNHDTSKNKLKEERFVLSLISETLLHGHLGQTSWWFRPVWRSFPISMEYRKQRKQGIEGPRIKEHSKVFP